MAAGPAVEVVAGCYEQVLLGFAALPAEVTAARRRGKQGERETRSAAAITRPATHRAPAAAMAPGGGFLNGRGGGAGGCPRRLARPPAGGAAPGRCRLGAWLRGPRGCGVCVG